jgi:NAD(P)H-dependent FMN reductase
MLGASCQHAEAGYAGDQQMKALVLSSSPRRDGNSAQLAQAVAEGLRESGHDADFVFAVDILGGFLRDCRACRNVLGECTIDDLFETTFFQSYLPAEGFVAATPIYWYGVSAQLKAFFDRMFCNVATSSQRSAQVMAQMQGKRIGLVLSSEETFPTVAAGPVHQVQEFARYTASTFVGVVHGIGNARVDIPKDPSRPLESARQFGRDFFDRHATDYRIDTPRAGRVWG